MDNNPVISIIIPIYNVERYVEKCLRSVLGQSLKNFEIIIVDDGSLDNSMNIVEEMLRSQQEIPFKIVHHPHNKGASAARNSGIAAAKLPYLIFVDNDDFVELNMVEVLFRSINEHAVDIVSGRVRIVDEDGKELLIMRHPHSSVLLTNIEAANEIFGKQIVPAFCYRNIYKRELFNGVHFPEELSMAEDAVTVPYAFLNAKKVLFVQDVVYNYVERKRSLSKRFRPDNARLAGHLAKMKAWLNDEIKDASMNKHFAIWDLLLTHDLSILAIKYAPDHASARSFLAAWKKHINWNELSYLFNKKYYKYGIKLFLLKQSANLYWRCLRPFLSQAS